MKNLLRSLVPLALLVGILLGVSPAQAAVTLTYLPLNGVNCYRHDGGTYPEDGHFYSCGSNATNDANVLAAVNVVMANYSEVRTRFQSNGVKFYMMDDAVAEYRYTSPGGTEQAYYNEHVGATGVTTTPSPLRVAIYNFKGTTVGDPTYPRIAPTQSPANTALHEMGHMYDFLLSGKSRTQLYLQLIEKDQVAFDVYTGGGAPAYRQQFEYFITRDHAPASDPSWKYGQELYADEFAAYVQRNNPSVVTTKTLLQSNILDRSNGNFACTAKVVERNILSAVDPNSVVLGAIGCSLPSGTPPVVCFEYRPTSSKGYPVPDPRVTPLTTKMFEFNAFYCGRTTDLAKETGTPSSARRTELFDGLATKLQAYPGIKNFLEPSLTKYYFFNNKTEAMDFFKYTAPYSSNTLYQGNNQQARCGSTFYNSSGVAIAAAIYDNCEVLAADGNSIQNPDLVRSAIYQTGHALNWAYGLGGGAMPADKSGFNTYLTQDKNNIGVNSTTFLGSTYSDADRTAMVCQAFGDKGNSKLERALLATTTSGQTGPVCTAGVVNSPWHTTSPANWHTPTQIAGNDKKIPSSFLTTAFYTRELWAEIFTLILMGGPPTDPIVFQNWLPITDKLLSTTAFPTVAGATPPRAFNCTRTVVESYVATGNPPSPVAGCPTVPAGSL